MTIIFGAFLSSFWIMLYGMLGIFIVTIVIIIAIVLLNKLTSHKKNVHQDAEE